MKLWCEFENIITDDSKAKSFCTDCRHVKCKSKGIFYCSEAPWASQSAKELWIMISQFNPTLCCRSVSNMKFWMKSQRKSWCQRELEGNVEIFVFTSKKELIRHANSDSILISRSPNIKPFWEARGGIFFLFDDSMECVKLLGTKIASLMEPKTDIMSHSVPIISIKQPYIETTAASCATNEAASCGSSYQLCTVVFRNLLFIVYGTKYAFDWTGEDRNYFGDKQYEIAEVFQELRSCKYCLINWAALYMRLELRKFWVEGTCDSLHVLSAMMCDGFGISCHEDAHCSDNKEFWESINPDELDTDVTDSLLATPHLRLLHLMVLNYCVGYNPQFVLTRISATATFDLSEPVHLESVFVNCKHLSGYRDAIYWRNRVVSLIADGRKVHKETLQGQWDALIAGEECLKDPPYSHRDVDIEQCIDDVLNAWRLPEWSCSDSSEEEDACSGNIPAFCGLALAWSDYSSLSDQFYESRLYHFLPLWHVVSGLLDCVSFLVQRAGWKRKRFTDNRWKSDYRICVGILRLLLRPQPFSQKTDHGNSLGIGDEKYSRHIDAMISSVRGKCWVYFLQCMRALGCNKADMDKAVHSALDACGQLRVDGWGGGMTAADIEEIELFAASYRAVVNKKVSRNKKKRTRRGKHVEQSACDLNNSADEATPPKQYVPPLAHFQRVFRGRLVRRRRYGSVEEYQKKRTRLIYEKASSSGCRDGVGLGVTYVNDMPIVPEDAMVSLNDRWQGMIVEKFALCRYLSLISASNALHTTKENSQQRNSDVKLDLYLVEPKTDCIRNECEMMRLSDFLETSKGPGAWVHGRVKLNINMPMAVEKPNRGPECSDGNSMSVEWLASYCEGSVWLTLMVLVLWEELYDPSLPLSMMRDFMDRPLDLLPERHYQNSRGAPIRSDGFYHRRRYQINSRLHFLRRLTAEEVRDFLLEAIQLHTGRCCFAINWSKVDADLILSIGFALGGVRLAVIVEEMIRDPVCYSRGMPDLLFCAHYSSCKFLGRIDSDKGDFQPWFHDMIFVAEVKSTHDKLSIWQKLWIRLFEKAGVPFEECRVT